MPPNQQTSSPSPSSLSFNNNNKRRQSYNKNTTTTTTSTKPKPKSKSKQIKPTSDKATTENAPLALKNDKTVVKKEEYGGDEDQLVAIQQRILHCYRDAFYNDISDAGGGDDDGNDGTERHEPITSAIQKVKQHLYHREFDAAFGEPGLREAYALRWSAGRAIGYLRVLEEWLGGRVRSCDGEERKVVEEEEEKGDGSKRAKDSLRRVVCLGGGGGAELVALAGWFARGAFREEEKKEERNEAAAAQPHQNMKLSVSIVDIADWSSVINQLHTAITSSIPISAYTSVSARAAAIAQARPLVQSSDIEVNFRQLDLLSDLDAIDNMTKIKLDVQEAWLLTIMFTMNELCHASFAKAYRLLSWLTANVPSGCLLLIVDSPGSYSSIGLKEGERKYPMRFYLDYALLGCRGSSNGDKGSGSAAWKRLVGEESRWLRHSHRLEYPVQLEDMRVQVHLFEKL